MSTTGLTYKQKDTYILDHGKIGQNVNRWLAQKIDVFGKTVAVEEATDKEFAKYIWLILPQLYKGQTTKMMSAFDAYFDCDWVDQMERAHALARLVEINRSREKEKRIRLFVEEERKGDEQGA